MKKIIGILLTLIAIAISLVGCVKEKEIFNYEWNVGEVYIEYSGNDQIETSLYDQGCTISLFYEDNKTAYISILNKESCSNEWQKIVDKNHTHNDQNDNLYYTAEDPNSKAYFIAFEAGNLIILSYEDRNIIDNLKFYMD